MTGAKASINLQEGVFEFEGDENFVERQMARFESMIEKSFYSMPTKQNQANPENRVIEIVGETGEPLEDLKGIDDFEDVFEIHEDNLHIIKDLPGDTVKAKTLSAALLVCYGKILTGLDSTLTLSVRQECERHGCYLPKKFASYIKSYNTLFLESGSGKESTLKLTVPGKRLAEDLVTRLKKDDIGNFFSQVKSKSPTRKSINKTNQKKSLTTTSGRPGPGAMINNLIEEGFFEQVRDIAEAVGYCKETKVQVYKNNEISVSLNRAVKAGKLKREKQEDGQYGYINP
jgi:hypothetical protein